MKLLSEDFALVYEALKDALRTDDQLEVVTKLSLGYALNEIGPPAVRDTLIIRVIETAESKDRVGPLIKQARKQNPDNVMLREAAEQLLNRLDVEPARKPPSSPSRSEPLPPIQSTADSANSQQSDDSAPLIAIFEASFGLAPKKRAAWTDAFDLESRLSMRLIRLTGQRRRLSVRRSLTAFELTRNHFPNEQPGGSSTC